MVDKDLIITPLLLLLVYTIAFFIRPFVTDKRNKKYFFPGLTLKIIGAIALGFIYQFYYKGGDTFTYFDLGSRFIYEAFLDSPIKGLKLIFSNGEYDITTFEYASKIFFYTDQPSYFVVRIAGVLDLLTFHTYSATAVLFAVISFSGLWAMFVGLYRLLPDNHFQLAIAIFFIPSVFFWGSGILKDTLTLGALGWGTYAFTNLFLHKKKYWKSIIILILSFLVIYEIKIYILLCFVPALIIWLYLAVFREMKNLVIKALVFPFSLVLIFIGGYLAIDEIGKENKRYNLEKISYTAESTARWLTYVSEREGGSVYTLGDFDFTMAGMLRKSPAAVWVTLFRPYLWEVKNPVMLLSAIESLFFLLLTVYTIIIAVRRGSWMKFTFHPVVAFCMFFAISFSFAVGISTYNFGSLVRYKIPMLPFYLIALFLMLHLSKRPKKLVRLASKE